MIDVSIVVPFYNCSNRFDSLYEMLLKQTLTSWELIIVDDGSKDAAVLRKKIIDTRDHRIILKSQEKNIGGGWVRNIGIQNSKGKYIAFLDSDDFWLPEKLKKQFCFSETNKAKFVFCDLKYVDQDGRELPMHFPKYSSETVSDFMFNKRGLIQTSSLFVDAELCKKVMFNPSLRRHQDLDFVIRLYHFNGRLDFIDEKLTLYVKNNISLVRKGASVNTGISWCLGYAQYLDEEELISFLSYQLLPTARAENKVVRTIFSLLSLFGFSVTIKTIFQTLNKKILNDK